MKFMNVRVSCVREGEDISVLLASCNIIQIYILMYVLHNLCLYMFYIISCSRKESERDNYNNIINYKPSAV